jgi:hypothetical protein
MPGRVVEQGMVVEECNSADSKPVVALPSPDDRAPSKDDSFTRNAVFGFTDTEAIKKKAREKGKNKKEAYNVHDYYYKTGFFQCLAKNAYFENTTLAVIVVNAIWIAVDSDENKAETLLDAETIFVFADVCFFGYFVLELFVRFMAFEKKCNCLKDAWFVFDSSLVALYLFDPFIIALAVAASGGGQLDLPTSVLRLFRLARLSRLVRMLRSLPELMIMIKGMVKAAATVSYTLGLLLLFTYVFAIAMTQMSIGTEGPYGFREKYFQGVALSMYSLIIYGTFLDSLAEFCDDIRAESTPCLILVTMFVVLASMTVMNMLIGVLCEVISAVAVEEKENMITEKVHEKFGNIVNELDNNQNGLLTLRELELILYNPEALDVLKGMNVDPEDLIDVADDFLCEKGSAELTFDDFFEMILDLRGGLEATLKDVYFVNKRFNKKYLETKDLMKNLHLKLDELSQESRPLSKGKTGNLE